MNGDIPGTQALEAGEKAAEARVKEAAAAALLEGAGGAAAANAAAVEGASREAAARAREAELPPLLYFTTCVRVDLRLLH